MTYIVNDACINCKHTDCVEVCPVDCFYEGANTLVINPVECIDCGVCEPECPEGAILPDTAEGAAEWVDINQKYADLWPVITQKKPAMPEAKFYGPKDGTWDPNESKTHLLDPTPGEGD
jgi:ferredoxin